MHRARWANKMKKIRERGEEKGKINVATLEARSRDVNDPCGSNSIDESRSSCRADLSAEEHDQYLPVFLFSIKFF